LADAVALVADITALTYAIALIRAPAPPAPMFDPFVEDQPFNLASRAGSQAYTNISAAFNNKDVWVAMYLPFHPLSHVDGIKLFKKLTTFTTVASLQLSLLSFNSILEFNPFDHAFDVPTINTKLMNLLTLATT